jgi:succinate dehydrogenase/fumarate reductase flavoprotein subunit
MNNLSCDVVVVGAGIAGWAAALRAVDQGVEVLIIDRSLGGLGDGNSLMTSGSYRAGGLSAKSNPQELYRQVMQEGIAYPDLAKAWAENCPKSVDWLKSLGIEMVDTSTGTIALEPYTSISLAPVYKKDVGTNILKKLKNEFMKQGGEYAAGVEAARLMASREGVSGLMAQRDGQTLNIESKTTILATGGFSANKEMLVRYIGKHADGCKLRGSASDTGDGLRMALEIGAKAVNLNYFYGHLISLKALTDDRFWPYPRLDSLVAEGILVDRSGSRFVDEGRGDVAVTNEVARSNDVTGTSLIFDEEAWSGAKGDIRTSLPRTPPPNPWLAENKGFLFKASSPGELAKQLGIDAVVLARTLERFNVACEAGSFETGITRTGKARALKPPYYGLKVVPGITFTMGGALINGRAEVLNLDEKPIRGLYAAGDAIGGLMGGFNGGYTGGLTQAVVTGMLAGDNAADFVKRI